MDNVNKKNFNQHLLKKVSTHSKGASSDPANQISPVSLSSGLKSNHKQHSSNLRTAPTSKNTSSHSICSSISSSSHSTPVHQHDPSLTPDCPLSAYLCSQLSRDYDSFSSLGHGNFGLVVKATHRATGREVAIKILKEVGQSGYQRRQLLSEI